MTPDNIFDAIPQPMDSEVFDLLAQRGDVKIERIVSKGHTSPASGWYDQEHNEWVIVLKGEAKIALRDGGEVHLEVIFPPIQNIG